MMDSTNRSPASLPFPEERRAAHLSRPAGWVLASAKRFDKWLLCRIRERLGALPIRFVLWDGTSLSFSSASPLASLHLRDRATLLKLVWNPQLEFGEAYGSGRLEVDGDLVACLECIFRAFDDAHLGRVEEPGWPLERRLNSVRASRNNVHHHYDLGNSFYRLWLDRQMLYTCAYFESPEASLEEAQEAKMDLVCRKLRLKPGESVVEAGGGWGALALYMARHYGVTVKSYNVSREQIRHARDLAAREGLSRGVQFVEGDYRSIEGRFDAFVSVGMLEHVGLEHYGELGGVIERCLGKGHGRGLLHFIGRDRPYPLNPWIRKHIFPGAYPPTLRQVMEGVLEPRSFSVLDVENLRLHYARTLAHWLARFEEAAEQVAGMFDESFVRAWRLYLAGSEASFTTGWLQLFQVVFARRDDNELPWTRAGLYNDTPGPGRHGNA